MNIYINFKDWFFANKAVSISLANLFLAHLCDFCQLSRMAESVHIWGGAIFVGISLWFGNGVLSVILVWDRRFVLSRGKHLYQKGLLQLDSFPICATVQNWLSSFLICLCSPVWLSGFWWGWNWISMIHLRWTCLKWIFYFVVLIN